MYAKIEWINKTLDYQLVMFRRSNNITQNFNFASSEKDEIYNVI